MEARQQKHRSGSVLPPNKASWQRIEDDNDTRGSIFKQRKAVSRKSSIKGSKQNEAQELEYHRGKDSFPSRPSTTTGFEDYFDATENSKKQRALKSKASLQELKQAAQWHQNVSERNCVSAVGDRYDSNKMVKYRSSTKEDTFENGHHDGLDFTDKIKAFRALINRKPRTSKHDISNEQLKKAKSFSDGIEKVGNHVRFNAESSDLSEIRSSTPARLLTEFQITYEHDRNRERKRNRQSTPQGFLEIENQVNFTSDSIRDTEIPASTHSRHQNELQMTYERDRHVRRHKGEFDSSYDLPFENVLSEQKSYETRHLNCFSEYESRDADSQTKNVNHRVKDNSDNTGLALRWSSTDSKDHLSSQTQGTQSKTEGYRVIRRPPHSGRGKENLLSESEYSGHLREMQTESAPSAQELDEVSKYRRPLSVRGMHSSSELSPDDALSSHVSSFKRSYSANPLSSSVQEHFTSPNLSGRHSSVAAKISNTNYLSRKIPPERSQSATPTSGRIHSNVGPSSTTSGSTSSLNIPEPSASLKTHLNVLGASLSSLSSRLNSGSESDIRSLVSESDRSATSSFVNGVRGGERHLTSAAIHSVRSGGREGLMMYGNRSANAQGSAVFDVSGVRVRLRDKHNIQTWSSSSDIHSEARESTGSVHSSKLGSCDIWRQTNVRVYDADEEMSSKSGVESDSLIRGQSSTSSSREKRKEELKKMVNLISKQRDSLRKYRKDESTEDEDLTSKRRSERSDRIIRSRKSELSDDNSEMSQASEDDTENITDSDDDDTWVESHIKSSSKAHSSSQGNKSTTGKRESSSVKVISRKIPLKALQSGSSEVEQVRNNVSEKSAIAKKNKKVEEKELKQASHKLEKSKFRSQNDDSRVQSKKKIIVKRPQEKSEGKTTHMSTEGDNVFHKPFLSRKETKSPSQLRSRSALSIFSASEDSSRNSPLPSKHSIQQFRDKQRSHSSLDTLNQTPKRLKSQIQSQLKGTHKGPKTGRTEQVSKEKRDLLRTKVRQLHQEVDDRLGSKENLAHSASFYKKRHGDSESSDELSDASTVVNSDSNDEGEKIKALKASGTHKSASSTFVTSTPLKDQDKKRRSGNREKTTSVRQRSFKHQNSPSEDSVDSDQERGKTNTISGKSKDSMKVLATNMRKIIESRKRMTPDFLSGYPSKNPSELDEDADEDDLEPTHRPRSGSVGAQRRSEVNKKDILSRLLTKMSNSSLNSSASTGQERNGHKDMTKWLMQSNGINMNGRDSPAESLLNHLDNPNMVKLLQKLYKADPATRQIIMIKVQFFKAWQYYAVSSREQRLRKESLTKKADVYLLERLLFYHFATWHIRATHSRNMRRAKALFRTHMLTKGFKALRWSVSQSRHQSEKLLTKVHSIMLKVTFQKWRIKSETQRKERIQNAMKSWKQFVMETQKIRHMQEVQDSNIMTNVLKCWKKRYNKRQKMNTAFSYLRQTLLKHTVSSWKSFVARCTEKKEKYTTAVSQHQHSLLKTTFYTMLITYKKSKKAKSHFRSHKLSEMFWAWKGGTQICRAERQQDMKVSREHWVKWKIKECFVHWRDKLMLCRAEKKANFNICKNAFLIWQKSWRDTIAHQEEIELTALRHKLHRSLLTWRQNVVQLQRRQKMAVALIENCHLKQTFRMWRLHTAAREILVKKALLHRIAHQRKALSSCFLKWQESYKQRKEEEHSKLLWSQACARKIAAHWRLVCHKRSLTRLYELTQPEREQRLMKALFSRWLQALERCNSEKQEAEDTRKILELCQLRRQFHLWQIETKRVLTIKPMVLKREKQRVSECFEVWRSYVQQRSRCKISKATFQKKMLKKAYSSWRRHYQACQIEKAVRTRTSQGLLLCLFEEWKFLIVRKRKGVEFRNEKLVQSMFFSWRNRASVQFTHRARLEKEAKDNLELKRWYFTQWLENVRSEVSTTDHCVGQFIFKQSGARLVKAFITWRQLMHSTLIARAYQKTQSQRLLLTLFLAWHETTSHSTLDAVHRFSERIGLVDSKMSGTKRMELGMSGMEEEEICYDEDDWNKSLVGSINSSFSFGSSARRLFGEGDHSLDTDGDRMILLSGGLQASVNDHQTRCQRLKDTVTAAVRRLMHWPLCLAFEQWKEFTARERHLKTAANQIKELHSVTEVTLAFREWKQNYRSALKARHFWNKCLLSSSLRALQSYKNHRKYVKSLSKTASHHYMLVVCSKVFPNWLQKTQDLRQEKHILHLWTSRTAREMELFPLENQLTKKLGQKLLLVCFSVWVEKYRGVAKIRRVYHNSLLSWLFTAWREWSVERHSLVAKSQNFLHRRQIKMAFQKWCERLQQSQETERRYHQAWKNYLHFILRQWRLWANANHRLHLCQQLFEVQHSKRNLAISFVRWKSLAEKVKGIRGNQMQKLTHSVFSGWRRAVIQSRNEKQKILRFQVHSYTLLVQRLFHQWHAAYREKQAILLDRRLHAEQCAMAFARVWRKKAVKTRGNRLKILLQKRQAAVWFQHWQNSFSKVQVLYDTLEVWMQEKNSQTVRKSLRTWRMQLIGDRARNLYTSRVLLTLMSEWRSFAKVSKERRIRGLALKKALQERSLHVYFQYWVVMTRVKQSVQHNVETKLQIRILRSWRFYTRNTVYLRELQAHFTQRVNTRILSSVFTTMRWRADYCASLQEMADKVVTDRERATMRAVMVMWRDRLDNILAARCYGQILVVRVARQWQRFVHRRKLERQRDKENWDKAIKCHQRMICKKAFTALKLEVTVSNLAQKRRQRLCNKYAMSWKTRVDLSVTAVSLECEFASRRAWNKWRMEYARRCSSNKVTRMHSRQVLTQIFNAWRKLCRRNSARFEAASHQILDSRTSSSSPASMLPVPISQTRASSPGSSLVSASEMSFGFKGGRKH